jgi:hypothetical protein
LRKRRTEKKNKRREKFGIEPKEAKKERVGVVKRILKKVKIIFDSFPERLT